MERDKAKDRNRPTNYTQKGEREVHSCRQGHWLGYEGGGGGGVGVVSGNKSVAKS